MGRRLLVALSQSGAGPDVTAVVEAARAAGAPTLAITNAPSSELAAAAELVLPIRAGEERSVAATKTYVASLVMVAGLVARLGPAAPGWAGALAFRPDGRPGTAVDEAVAAARRTGSGLWLVGGRELTATARALVMAEDLPEPLTPLAYVLPAFLVAEAVARARGHNPDAPEGLSKVTRTR